MKLVIQIALGVFLGSLPALLIVEAWQNHRQELARMETEKLMEQQEEARLEQGERLRAILNQNQQINPALAIPNSGFVPDHAPTGSAKP